MCGRFTLKTPPDQWGQLLLPLIDAELEDQWRPRYNIAPTQDILAIANSEEQQLRLDYFRWGLVPGWAGDLTIGNRMINARAETLAEKKSFAKPFESKRCVVVADGYFEWQKLEDGSKQPCWISPADGGIVLLAGLWERNRKATDQLVQSCTIITTAANEQLESIHDRMPVVLEGVEAEHWLDPKHGIADVDRLLKPLADGKLQVTQVSKIVNNARNEGPDCLVPIDE